LRAGRAPRNGFHGIAFDATDLIVTMMSTAERAACCFAREKRGARSGRCSRRGDSGRTGYICGDGESIPTTLGRGGSDFSATILAPRLTPQESSSGPT